MLRAFALVGLIFGSTVAIFAGCKRAETTAPAVATVGDVRAVHADVRIGERAVQGEQRIEDGDRLTTGPEGRARVRLDDGTLIAVDASTTFSLKGKALTLESGRLFVQGGPVARTEVTVGDISTTVSSSAVAFERRGATNTIYCAQGELVLRAKNGGTTRVASGETAKLEGKTVTVAPEKAFDDWTGGLAVPWTSELGDRTAIAEVRGGSGGADVGSELVVRSHKVDVEINGELAITRSRTKYFNGGGDVSRARFRLALPEGAVLTRVAKQSQGNPSDVVAALGLATNLGPDNGRARLDWAGGGNVRGELGSIAAGATLELALEWVEWLPNRSGRTTYRFPMEGRAEPALVNELSAHVDATRTETPFVTANAGAVVQGRTVEFRQADVRPTADLVVELAPRSVKAGAARAYVSPGSPGEDGYVLVRTEVPDRKDTGLTLALVVDSSMSVSSGALETGRAVVDAVLEGLGPRDSVVVFAADQTVRPIGAEGPAPLTPALRDSIRQGLSALRPGGASNLGAALQKAADVLDAPSRGESAGSGMVVYVGDGRPTVGEPGASAIRRLIGRRPTGMPRLGAIAVGAGADKWMLAELVAGVGSVYEVADRADAARAGATLLADALEPTLRDVEMDLGPNVDRIYPREARAVVSGSTVSVVGRLRGELPTQIGFRFRDGAQLVSESRSLVAVTPPPGADVARRWALARIEELAARREGIEPAIALAAANGLLTPWTSFFFEGGTESTPPFSERLLGLSPNYDTPYAARIDGVLTSGSTLLEPSGLTGGGVSLEDAAAAAVRRILEQARGSIRACRDARASVRPDVSQTFRIQLAVDGGGHATRVTVVLGDAGQRDAVLERCIESVVRALPYFAAGVTLNLEHTLNVPDGRSSRRTKCSEASKVALPLRRSIWGARPVDAQAFVTAAMTCELPTWTDRRAFLMLLLERVTDGAARLAVASELDAAGETDAAVFLRKETLRRVVSFAELTQLSQLLAQDEPDIGRELDKAYRKATSDEERLAVVRRFLLLSPHSTPARRRLIALLEVLGRKESLAQEVEHMRAEPFIDAGLLAQGASSLRRIGLEADGRRAFGELIERAPNDPWTLAFVGDRLRAEGMFDEAGAAYDSLERLIPNEAAVALRLALAHAGAGRLDVATRLLERVTQTGGRNDSQELGELASITEAVLLAEARGTAQGDLAAQLDRRLLRTPLPDVGSVLMVLEPPSDDPIVVRVARDGGEREELTPDYDARVLGMAAVRVERGEGKMRLRLSRAGDPGPSRPRKAQVFALVLGGEDKTLRLLRRVVDVAADGKAVELEFSGGEFL